MVQSPVLTYEKVKMKHNIKDQTLYKKESEYSRYAKCKNCGCEITFAYLEVGGYGTGAPIKWVPVNLEDCMGE
jgi:hypothetical protein